MKQGFSIIPIKNGTKQPSIKWSKYQTIRADEKQIAGWFKQSDSNIAIVTGKISSIIELDVDGQEAAEFFHNVVETVDDSDLKNKIRNTMKIKTSNGNVNYIIGFNTAEFSAGAELKTTVLWRGKGEHSELRLKGERAYAIAPPSRSSSGNHYELVDGMLRPEILSKQQLTMLIAALRNKEARGSGRTDRKNWIRVVISLIKPYYNKGSRNDLVMYLSGWLRKEDVTMDDASKIVEGIYEEDEEKAARIKTVEETYRKESFNDLKGYSGLLEIFTSEVGEIQAYKLLAQLQSLVQGCKKGDSNQESEIHSEIIEDASKAIMNKHRFLTLEETREIWYYHAYMKRIESVFEEIKAADRIQEDPWQQVVVRELNEISKDCAKELQAETGQVANKGNYQLGLNEWPPTRILSLILSLSAWVGWIMHEKHGSSENSPLSSRVCLQMIQEAFGYGVHLSVHRQTP
jgi:hypothetical protein